MNLTPLGGAGTVTGSRFLVRSEGARVLVDCGLFQGLKALRLRNWAPFPIPPREIDAVVLTHAHLDHSGYLPILVRDGFEGPVYVTPPTADLLPLLLEDAGRLQEEDARWANRKGFSKHSPALPLFTEADAERASRAAHPRSFDEEWEAAGLRFQFQPAGHVLGAASLVIRDPDDRTICISGDLGRSDDPLLPGPAPRPETGLLLMESTYGDRAHPDVEPEEALTEALESAFARGGVAMIASFAVGRTQTLALLLHRLMESGKVPTVPVFLDSPMAIRATELHVEHADHLRPEPAEVEAAMRRMTPTATVDESRDLNSRRGPMVVIAGAGMLTGGRILHHLRAFGEDSRNALILPGFQAEGTRGRRLRDGDRTIKLHGRHLTLRCQVHVMDALSGHADAEALMAWATHGPEPEDGVVLVHGEAGAADVLRRELHDRTGWKVTVGEEGCVYP